MLDAVQQTIEALETRGAEKGDPALPKLRVLRAALLEDLASFGPSEPN